ncbi:hypothetical protein Slala05_84320 [Streptomyces lavendulae subsp. lavendulae]|nr:hypothetical protein Slala05_84320 [Streptomyces lavendulae subsp. lavendulae]
MKAQFNHEECVMTLSQFELIRLLESLNPFHPASGGAKVLVRQVPVTGQGPWSLAW